jgi:hypothetical protein
MRALIQDGQAKRQRKGLPGGQPLVEKNLAIHRRGGQLSFAREVQSPRCSDLHRA